MQKKSLEAKKKNSIKRGAALLLCILTALSGPGPLSARVVLVQKENVNVRQSAGTSAAVIGRADKGMIFAWRGAAENWTQIRLASGGQGYIRNDMLQGYDEITVTGSGVRIRKTPSLQGEVLGGVQRGEALTVLDYQPGWWGVLYGQTTGWISADYAKPGTPVALTAGSSPAGQDGSQSGGGQGSGDQGGGQGGSQSGNGQGHNMSSVSVSPGFPGGILSGKVITLDPGHGTFSDGDSVDPGAQGTTIGFWEKDVNLDVTLKLKVILESLGATVWVTHTGSTSLNLYGRAAVANQNASDIFVSIHSNASEKPSLAGHSVYFYAPPEDSRLGSRRNLRMVLARHVQESMVSICGRADLGIKESNFVVLRETDCPSILVETAFLTNAEDELLLAQGGFRQKLAEAVAQGIKKYFGVA